MTNPSLEIKTEKTVANSKAFVFLLEQYLAIVKAGHADMELSYSNSSTVTYALIDGEVVGACAWYIDQGKRAAWILFSAVAPDRRRQGIYSAIAAAVEKQAKTWGAVALYSGVHVTNDAMIAAAQGTGRKLGWYRAKKDL